MVHTSDSAKSRRATRRLLEKAASARGRGETVEELVARLPSGTQERLRAQGITTSAVSEREAQIREAESRGFGGQTLPTGEEVFVKSSGEIGAVFTTPSIGGQTFITGEEILVTPGGIPVELLQAAPSEPTISERGLQQSLIPGLRGQPIVVVQTFQESLGVITPRTQVTDFGDDILTPSRRRITGFAEGTLQFVGIKAEPFFDLVGSGFPDVKREFEGGREVRGFIRLPFATTRFSLDIIQETFDIGRQEAFGAAQVKDFSPIAETFPSLQKAPIGGAVSNVLTGIGFGIGAVQTVIPETTGELIITTAGIGVLSKTPALIQRGVGLGFGGERIVRGETIEERLGGGLIATGGLFIPKSEFQLALKSQKAQARLLVSEDILSKEAGASLIKVIDLQKTFRRTPDPLIEKPITSVLPEGFTIPQKEVGVKVVFEPGAEIFGGQAFALRGIRKTKDIDISLPKTRVEVTEFTQETAALFREVSPTGTKIISGRASVGLGGEKAFDIKSIPEITGRFPLKTEPVISKEGVAVITTQEQVSRAISGTLELRKGGKDIGDIILGGRALTEEAAQQAIGTGLPGLRRFRQQRVAKAERVLVEFERVALPEIRTIVRKTGEAEIVSLDKTFALQFQLEPLPIVPPGKRARVALGERMVLRGFREAPLEEFGLDIIPRQFKGRLPKRRDRGFPSEILPSRIKPSKITPSIFPSTFKLSGLKPSKITPSKITISLEPSPISPSIFKPEKFVPSGPTPSKLQTPQIFIDVPPPTVPVTTLFPGIVPTKKKRFARGSIEGIGPLDVDFGIKRRLIRTPSLGAIIKEFDLGIKQPKLSVGLERTGLAERAFLAPQDLPTLGPIKTKRKTKRRKKK